MITQTRLKELLNYNENSGVFTWINKNKRANAGDIAGGKNSKGYLQIRVDSKLYKAHRLAWLYIYGYFPNGAIDHINHIRHDNKISNLRDVSIKENSKNKSIQSNNKSGHHGIYFVESTNRWNVQIGGSKDRIYLGSYDNINDAIIVRNNKEKELLYHDNHG